MAMLASASPADLLVLDDEEPWADLERHPLWSQVLSGDAPRQIVLDLVLAFYPVFTGDARYLLAAKVSRLELEDGKEIFADLYRSLTVADADADRGWERLATALGLTSDDLDAARTHPSPVAADLVTIIREHSHRSAHEGVGIAWVLDRRLPKLLGNLADALSEHYGVAEEALSHLRERASEDAVARERADRLVARYLSEPWDVFEARRAGREVLWDLTALLEEVARG